MPHLPNNSNSIMKLQELLLSSNWADVQKAFLGFYPDEEEDIKELEKVYQNLNALTPVESDLTLTLSLFEDEDEPFVHVSGKNQETDEDFSLGFVPWAEWLGMEIDEISLTDFSQTDIVAHSLFEMTFFGFSEEEIQETLTYLDEEEE